MIMESGGGGGGGSCVIGIIMKLVSGAQTLSGVHYIEVKTYLPLLDSDTARSPIYASAALLVKYAVKRFHGFVGCGECAIREIHKQSICSLMVQ